MRTYPPTQCGLATFTAALYSELVTSTDGLGRVVRVVDAASPRPGPEVMGSWSPATPAVRTGRPTFLATPTWPSCSEYGVYGGADGDEVLHLLKALSVPSIVVLHTVLSAPTRHQREVLEAVADSADAVVVITPPRTSGWPLGTR